MRRLIGILLLIIALFVVGCASDTRSYSADRYDVNIAVEDDGALQVTETVTFDFEGGPFQYVFRDIPTERTDGITDIEASMNGDPLPLGDEAGQVEIEEHDDSTEVTWHFAPTSDATHTFTLNYRAEGVVRQEPDADLLVWQALPTEHDYTIAASQVRVSYPENATLSACPGVESTNAQIASGAQQATFTARDLGEDAPLCVTLAFAPGAILSAPPAWQAREVELRPYAPLAANLARGLGALSLALLVGGILWLILFLQRHRHTTPPQPSMPGPNVPPSSLSPAIAGTLNAYGTQPSWTNAAATLFDLARRGVLRMEMLPKGRWESQNVLIHLEAEPADLRPHERGLLDLLFEDKAGRQTSVRSSDLSGRSSSRWQAFADPLRQEMEQMGLISAERLAPRKQLQRVALGLLLIGLLALGLTPLIFGVPTLESIPVNLGGVGWVALLSVGASLLLLSLVFAIAASAWSPLTEAGALAARQWQGFFTYLRDVTKGREPFARTDLFETYLPYAASYGLSDAWIKHFQKRGEVPHSPWLQSLATVGDDGFVAIIAINAAVGSDGGAGSAAGAAGAAGGGASGAG